MVSLVKVPIASRSYVTRRTRVPFVPLVRSDFSTSKTCIICVHLSDKHVSDSINGSCVNATLHTSHLWSPFSQQLQQDNGLCQRVQFARNWFEEHSVVFRKIVRPAHYSDISRMQYFWYMLEQFIRTQDPMPTNVRKPWTANQRVRLNTSSRVF